MAGRLQEALQEQIDQSGLPGVRVAKWPQVIADQASALSTSQAMSATLVVWGEYDSGRVLADVQARYPQGNLSGKELRRQVGALSELSFTINSELPQELKWMTFYVLGEAYLRSGRSALADERIAQRFGRPSLKDQGALAGIYYDLGSIEGEKPRPDLNQVIAYTTLAIEHSPQFASAFNNRGVAYLNRRAEGDKLRAVKDLVWWCGSPGASDYSIQPWVGSAGRGIGRGGPCFVCLTESPVDGAGGSRSEQRPLLDICAAQRAREGVAILRSGGSRRPVSVKS